MLRPLAPLDLPEHARVEFELHGAATQDRQAVNAQIVRETLRRAGASISPLPLANAARERLSSEEQDRLAHRFSAERSFSDFISEDRDGREF